jgi:hypothetical protein
VSSSSVTFLLQIPIANIFTFFRYGIVQLCYFSKNLMYTGNRQIRSLIWQSSAHPVRPVKPHFLMPPNYLHILLNNRTFITEPAKKTQQCVRPIHHNRQPYLQYTRNLQESSFFSQKWSLLRMTLSSYLSYMFGFGIGQDFWWEKGQESCILHWRHDFTRNSSYKQSQSWEMDGFWYDVMIWIS